MPKFRFLADVDSIVEEAEHLESIFEDGIEAESEKDALKIVDKKVKELMYGGPYYTVTDDDDLDYEGEEDR